MTSSKAAESFSFWRSTPARLPVLDSGVPIVQLAPRIYALIYQEDRNAWKAAVSSSELSHEYTAFLADGAAALQKLRCPGSGDKPQLLLANLGPAWKSPAMSKLFRGPVLELDGWKAWERPPALGAVPLDIILGVCQELFKWLHACDAHMAVLHVRVCSTQQSGHHLAALLAAAYQLYALQEDTLWGAVHVQHTSSCGWPPLPPSAAAAETAAIRQLLGSASTQYGRYVERVLHAGTLPPMSPTALQMQRIIISAFEVHKLVLDPDTGSMVQGDLVSTGRSVLAVFQRGQQIWSCAATAQDDLIGFRVGVPLDGDIVIALWFGDMVRDTDMPAFSYAFHTAFVGSGVLRVEPRDMTVPAGSPLNPERAAFDGFFMDISLEDGHQKLIRDEAAQDQVDVRGMRARWQRGLLAEGMPEARLRLGHSALASQLGAVAAAGLTPSGVKAVHQREQNNDDSKRQPAEATAAAARQQRRQLDRITSKQRIAAGHGDGGVGGLSSPHAKTPPGPSAAWELPAPSAAPAAGEALRPAITPAAATTLADAKSATEAQTTSETSTPAADPAAASDTAAADAAVAAAAVPQPSTPRAVSEPKGGKAPPPPPPKLPPLPPGAKAAAKPPLPPQAPMPAQPDLQTIAKPPAPPLPPPRLPGTAPAVHANVPPPRRPPPLPPQGSKGAPRPPPPPPLLSAGRKAAQHSAQPAAATGGGPGDVQSSSAALSIIVSPSPDQPGDVGAPEPDNPVAQPPPKSQPKFRILHWSKVPRRPGTVWEDLPPQPAPLAPDQAALLAHLFSVQAHAPLRRSSGSGAQAAQKAVHIVGISRANNIAIMLTQFASWDDEDIRAAALDDAGLSTDKLSLLLQIAPSEEEVTAMRKYEGSFEDLAPPEKVLAHLASVPRLTAKLRCAMFRRQAAGLIAEASSALRCVQAACGQVRDSRRLRQIFTATLAAGNALNVGTSHTGALGFSVGTLQKLASLKVTLNSPAAGGVPRCSGGADSAAAELPQAAAMAAPRIRSLLDYVAWLSAQEGGGGSSSRRSLSNELAAMDQAAARMQGGLAEALRDLDAGVEALAAEHRQCLKAADFAAAASPIVITAVDANSCAASYPPPGHAASTATDIGAPDSPIAAGSGGMLRSAAGGALRVAASAYAAIAPASRPATPKAASKATPTSGKLDFLSVSAEASELAQHPLIAAQEASALLCCLHVGFAGKLEGFLGEVKTQREQLLDLSADTQLQVTVLLKWLGEAADTDPQTVFSSIAQFARAFDKAYAVVTN